MSSGSGGGLNIFGRYLGGGGNKRNAGANANGNGAPGGSSSNREPHNLPKILRATVDTGREVNVIEAKAARSQPKKVVSMISSPVVTRSHSPARPPIHSSSSAVTPTGSPLLQKRMQFKINVTPSGKGSSSTPLNSKSLRSTTCECDVNGNRLNFVNNKTTTTGATGGDLRCSIDVVKENNLARLFGSKSSSSSKQTSNSNTFTRSRTNKADSGGLSNFAVNFNVALNMERSDAHEEIDLPRGAAHKEAAESKGGDEQGTAAAAAAASASLEDIYSDPMTADTSIEQARNSSGDGGQRLSLSLDTASSLKVAVRLRPFSAAEAALSSGKALDVLIKDDQVLLPHRKEYFKFDHCLNSSDQELFNYADQETVYRKMGEPLLEYAFRGYNTCLFAYGQSGSGKTYTMMGSEVVPGIIPRFLNDLFKRISSPRASYLPSGTTTTTEYIVNVSFMEIYNEKIHDLLADQFEAIRKGPLKVREHPETGPFVEDLTVYTVESYENAMELLASGNERRTTASTAANEQSSRSHTIFTVILVQNKTVTNGGGGGGGGDEPGWGQPQQEQPEESTTSTTISKVHLVDLAGSERASAVSAAKDRQREGTFINKSLLTLGKVISQLAEAAKAGSSSSSSLKAAGGEAAEQQTNGNSAHPHIPYRDSALTFLLKDSLGGNSRTSMIATISPAKEHLEETVSTLRYASTASKIVNVVHVNEDPKMKVINSLLKQISFLKREVESATAAAAAVKSSEEQQQQQPKQFETTAAPPPAVVPPPPPPTSSTEPEEKKEEEEIAVSVDVNLDESKDVEDGSTAEFASAPTSPPSFVPVSPASDTAPALVPEPASLPEDYCSGACTKRITVKLEQLDGKFNQLLQNQRSFEEKLAGFVETVAASSPPSLSTGSKTLETLPPSLAMSSKVVDELKSLLAKVKSESAGIGKDKDKDFEALLKSMESPAAVVDDDYLEDDDHLLATVETSRKEAAASKDSPPAVATEAISAWTSKGNHNHNNNIISNKDKPMITKPMNDKEKKAAEAAQKAADAAQKRKEEKEAREAKEKKEAEEKEAAKRKEEAEKEAEAKKEAREKAEQEKAEKVAKQKEEKEAREAKRKEAEEAEAKRKADEKEAREKADKEKADKVAKQKAEKEAAEEKKKQEEKAEREAKQKAEKEAKEAKRKEEEAAEAKKKADKEKAEKEKAEKEAAEAKKKAQAEEEEAKKKAEEEAAAAEAEKKKAEEEEAATKAANDNDDDDDGFMPLSKKDKRKLLKAKKFEAAEEEVEEEVTPAAASTANSDDDDNDFELPPKNLKGNALKKWKKEQREKNLAKLKKATEEAKEKVEVDEEKGEEEKEEVAARPPKKLTPKEQKKLDREKKKADKKNKKGKKGGGGDSDESGDDGEEEEEEAKFTIELGKNQKKDGDDSDDEAKSGKKKAKKGKKGK